LRKFRRVRRGAACCSRKKALDIRNPDIQKEAKEGGSNRIIGRYGTKIWDDAGGAKADNDAGLPDKDIRCEWV
jgi:hypothetical protein